ncbi:MAG TPA: GYD domain-containing protein [Stellaceae bacterium]
MEAAIAADAIFRDLTEDVMPKYMIHAAYTAEGLKGLQKDKGSGRREVINAAISALGGKLEGFYFAFGEDDVVSIADMPDNMSMAALAVAVSASGLVRTKVIPLLTAEEVDKALQKSVNYRAPGR